MPHYLLSVHSAPDERREEHREPMTDEQMRLLHRRLERGAAAGVFVIDVVRVWCQRTSTTSLIPVLSSPSSDRSTKDGMHTRSRPPGRT